MIGKPHILDATLKAFNTSKAYYTGRTFETKQYGTIKIIGQIDTPYINPKGKKSYVFFIVEFEDGTQETAHMSNISKGAVANLNTPTLFGRGCVGIGRWRTSRNNKDTKEYQLWQGMMDRCYGHNPKYEKWADCEVDKRWWNFQVFCTDLLSLENYNEWKNNTKSHAWQLDKDIKILGNRIYGYNFCKFVTIQENIEEMLSRNLHKKLTGKIYQATHKITKEIIEFTNQRAFCRDNDVDRAALRRCLKGLAKSAKGWEFIIKE